MDIDEIIAGGGLVFPKAPKQGGGPRPRKSSTSPAPTAAAQPARKPSTASSAPTGGRKIKN